MAHFAAQQPATIDENTSLPAQSMAWAHANQRRSSRLLLSVRIVVSGANRENGISFEASGNTLVVNKHGALIRTIEGLSQGMKILVTVPSRNQSVRARVVWSNPALEGKYGIEFESPCDLWGVCFPPEAEDLAPPMPHIN